MSNTHAAAPGTGTVPALRGFGLPGIIAIVVILLAGGIGGIPLGALLAIGWARLGGTPLRELGFVAPRRAAVTVPVAIGFGVAFKLFLKSIVMPLLGADPVNHAYHFLVGNSAALPGAILTMIVAAGFGEETVFRGFLFERARAAFGDSRRVTLVAVLTSSVLFAAAHLPEQGWAGAEQAWITGLVFGSIFARTRSLPFLMIAHAAFDLTAVAILYADVETKLAHFFFK